MEEVIQILMKRDGMSRAEAVDLTDHVRRRLLNATEEEVELEELEDIFMEELGLEPDYILDFI